MSSNLMIIADSILQSFFCPSDSTWMLMYRLTYTLLSKNFILTHNKCQKYLGQLFVNQNFRFLNIICVWHSFFHDNIYTINFFQLSNLEA